MQTHRETFQASQSVGRIEENQTTERKRRPVKQKAEGSSFILLLQPFTFQILSVVSPPSFPILLDGSQLSNFWHLHLPRSWPCTLQLKLCICVCARGCQSEFLTSSSSSVMTSVLTRGLEKRGSSRSLVFLYPSPLHPMMDPQRGRGSPVLMPSAVSGVLSTPSQPIQHLIPSSSPELLISSSPSSSLCDNTEYELLPKVLFRSNFYRFVQITIHIKPGVTLFYRQACRKIFFCLVCHLVWSLC